MDLEDSHSFKIKLSNSPERGIETVARSRKSRIGSVVLSPKDLKNIDKPDENSQEIHRYANIVSLRK